MIQKSETPTGEILIKAQLCSEWDSCNSCLVAYTEKDLEKWKRWDSLATECAKDNSFHCIILWEGSDFLNLDDDSIIPEEWCYVTADIDNIEDDQRPEQKTDAHQMRFYGNGKVCFCAYGKHTAEEFFSDTININELK